MNDYEKLLEKVFRSLSPSDIRLLARRAKMNPRDLKVADATSLQSYLEEEGLISEKNVTWLRTALESMGRGREEHIVYQYEVSSSFGKLIGIVDRHLTLSDLKRLARYARIPNRDVHGIENTRKFMKLITDRRLLVTRNVTWLISAVQNCEDISNKRVVLPLKKYQGTLRLGCFVLGLAIYFSESDTLKLAINAGFGNARLKQLQKIGWGAMTQYMVHTNNYNVKWILNLVENSRLPGSAPAAKALRLYQQERAKTVEATKQAEQAMKRLTLE